jgi:hypothetical protein
MKLTAEQLHTLSPSEYQALLTFETKMKEFANLKSSATPDEILRHFIICQQVYPLLFKKMVGDMPIDTVLTLEFMARERKQDDEVAAHESQVERYPE